MRLAPPPHAPTRILPLIALLPLMLLLAACAGYGTRHYLTSERFPPRPADYSITLTDGNCDRPCEAIAEVTTHPCEARVVDTVGRQELEKTARKLGGDAVVRVARKDVTREEIGYQNGGVLRWGTNFVERTTLSGVVVRFTGNP